MASEDQTRLFSRVDILEPLEREDLATFSRRIPVVGFDRNYVIYTPDYEGDMIFILLEGRVRTYKVVGAREITLDMLEAGTIFGSTVLAAKFQHAYERPWAEALEASRVGLLRREAFERLVASNPEVGLRALHLFSKRLYAVSNRMADIALKEVPARLASLILYMIEAQGVGSDGGFVISIRHTHRELGSMIGADRVAVTRAFNALREAGAVELVHRQIHIKDFQTLKRLAAGR